MGDGSAFGLDVTYIQQEAPLGLAHAVLVSRAFLGDEDFIIYLGDNFIVGGITSLATQFAATPPWHATLTRSARRLPCPAPGTHARTARLSRGAEPGGQGRLRVAARALRTPCDPGTARVIWQRSRPWGQAGMPRTPRNQARPSDNDTN